MKSYPLPNTTTPHPLVLVSQIVKDILSSYSCPACHHPCHEHILQGEEGHGHGCGEQQGHCAATHQVARTWYNDYKDIARYDVLIPDRKGG